MEKLKIEAAHIEWDHRNHKIKIKGDQTINPQDKNVYVYIDQKTIQAHSIYVKGKNPSEVDFIEANGNVRITYKDLSLQGDQCVYRPHQNSLKDGVVVCTGNVVITHKNQTLKGHVGTFDLMTHTHTLQSGTSQAKIQGVFPVKENKDKLIKKPKSKHGAVAQLGERYNGIV